MAFVWCPPTGGPPALRGFWIGRDEVTRGELDAVTMKRPARGLATRPDHPRDAIRYPDVLQFVGELNRRQRFSGSLPAGWEYALPTATEWAHAAGAGAPRRGPPGVPAAGSALAGNFADRALAATGEDYYQYADRGRDDGFAYLAPTGSFPANAWGIHDLYGNLWEWTAADGPGDPVALGGSWASLAAAWPGGFRRRFPRESELPFLGFRLVLRRRGRPVEPDPQPHADQ